MHCATSIIALLLLALPLASCSSVTMTLYRGEMALVAVSGSGCIEKNKAGSRLPLNLTLAQGTSSNGQQITGFFSGPDVQSGRFFGNDLGLLQVVYPDAPNSSQGNTLGLFSKPVGVDGELREKPQSDPADCYFEKAVLTLKQVATGKQAESAYARQSNLFAAEAYFISGQSLLKADKPDDAIRELTKSLHLRNMVNPHDPERAIPAVSIAIAHIMSARKPEALAVIRALLGDKSDTGAAILKQRSIASSSLCSDEQYLESGALEKAVAQLMDMVALEFGRLNGVAVPLAECYYEMAKEHREQDDPDLAIELFQKALKLNPDNPDNIAGVVMSFIDMETPAKGRRYLHEHAENFIKRGGKKSYDTLLSYLCEVEAQQAVNSGDLPLAEELSREAVTVGPGERTLVIELTRVLGKEGKITEARKLLEGGSNSCNDATCREEYADELARQDMIARMVKRLAAPRGMR